MTKEQAENILVYMKLSGDFTAMWNSEIVTAEDLLTIIKGRTVTYQQAINYLTK